jgi:hypothetical protein
MVLDQWFHNFQHMFSVGQQASLQEEKQPWPLCPMQVPLLERMTILGRHSFPPPQPQLVLLLEVVVVALVQLI